MLRPQGMGIEAIELIREVSASQSRQSRRDGIWALACMMPGNGIRFDVSWRKVAYYTAHLSSFRDPEENGQGYATDGHS